MWQARVKITVTRALQQTLVERPPEPLAHLGRLLLDASMGAAAVVEAEKAERTELERRVKDLEARLAAAPPPTPPASAALKRIVDRKPQTAPRLHSRPKPAGTAALMSAAEASFASAEPSKWGFPEVRYGGAYSFSTMGCKAAWSKCPSLLAAELGSCASSGRA